MSCHDTFIRNELHVTHEIPLQSFRVCVFPEAGPEEGGSTGNYKCGHHIHNSVSANAVSVSLNLLSLGNYMYSIIGRNNK